MTSPTKMGIAQGEWDWMNRNPSMGQNMAPFAMLASMLYNQQRGNQGNTMPAVQTGVPGQAPAPQPQGNPFGNLMASLPASGWSNPNAQAWTQQALSQPYMQGWGAPAGAPAAPGAAPAAAAGPRAAGDIVVSDQAKKMLKQFRKAKKAGDFGLQDAAMLAGNIALGVATGGTSLAGQLAGGALGGASSLYGSDQKRKSIASQTGKVKKIRNTGMAELGYARGKGGDYVDAAGNKLGGAKVFQALLDAGYFGTGG